MATTAELGYGQILAYSADGVSYTDVSQTVDIDGPDLKVPSKEVTNNESANAALEKIPGLLDGGQITLNLVAKHTNLNALYGLVRLIRYWRITYPDTHTWVCQGFWTSLKPSSKMGDPRMLDLTIELTGKPTYS